MSEPIRVLDNGYVRFIEAWGTGDAGNQENCTNQNTIDYECGIIEAARQSTQGSFRGWDIDSKLQSYLYNEEPKHATPFEFSGMILEVKAPIFVIREWQRHRTHSITDDEFSGDWAFNEMSARYAPIPNEHYIPSIERLLCNSKTNKQAGTIKDSIELSETTAKAFQEDLKFIYIEQEDCYKVALLNGVPKELARLIVPVGRYVQMRVTAYLRNWLGFCTLRSHSKAQWEIQEYSRAVESIIKDKFPRTYNLFLSRKHND